MICIVLDGKTNVSQQHKTLFNPVKNRKADFAQGAKSASCINVFKRIEARRLIAIN